DACRITSWTGNEHRVLNFGPINLRQPINRFLKQVWGWVFMCVKLPISFGTFKAKIRTQVDNTAPKLNQRNCKLGGNAVRKREKHDFCLFRQQFRVWFSKAKGLGF